jgi:hypothetical protein
MYSIREVLELHRIVIAVPTDQACVCDYVDIANLRQETKIFEDDVDLELSTCFDRQINIRILCTNVSTGDGCYELEVGNGISTSKHIERYLTLRAMCVDPSPLPFVKDEDQQGSLQNGLRRIFGTCKSLADHKTNKTRLR